jgi:hypothetical protein
MPTRKSEKPKFTLGQRVKTPKRGYGIIVELNDTDEEAKVGFTRNKRELWFAFRELEITGR